VTLPGASPRTPRLAPRLRTLEAACRDGRQVELCYGETEQAPVWLGVRPRILYATKRQGYLEAECVRSGLLKTYRLDRVHRVRA
jgi:predicted DNA-binding transcriptional regulator YafY